MKRIMSIVLTALLLLSLAACSESKESAPTTQPIPNETPATPTATAAEGAVISNPGVPTDTLIFDQNSDVEPGEPQKKLDPTAVYENLTYIPQMFYGDYRILGGDEGEQAYAAETPLVECQVFNYKNESVMEQITAVPYRLKAGPHTFSHIINNVENYDFLEAYFYTDSGNLTFKICTFTIDGNTLTLTPLAFYEYNRETRHIRYILSETQLTYQFQFEGRKLTLTDGKNTVTLHSALDVTTDDSYLSIDSYCAANSPMLHNIEQIFLTWRVADEDFDAIHRISADVKDSNQTLHPYAVMEDNGLFTITIAQEEADPITQQFVYFYCRDDGLILTDGETTYFYTADSSDGYSQQLTGNMTYEDLNALENMQQEELEQIVETKEDLLADLTAAFEDAGLAVTIDPQTGEVAMDAAVLFPVGEYTVSDEGKELLQQFIEVYTGVIFNEKYDGFISKIMVEGHTDSTGVYEENLTLSQNRADSVKALCLEYGQDCTAQLTEMMQAVGYSSDNLILDEAGNEDMDASRRVCFRFIININK